MRKKDWLLHAPVYIAKVHKASHSRLIRPVVTSYPVVRLLIIMLINIFIHTCEDSTCMHALLITSVGRNYKNCDEKIMGETLITVY